jgi:hypothetical protein
MFRTISAEDSSTKDARNRMRRNVRPPGGKAHWPICVLFSSKKNRNGVNSPIPWWTTNKQEGSYKDDNIRGNLWKLYSPP